MVVIGGARGDEGGGGDNGRGDPGIVPLLNACVYNVR